MHLCNKFAGTAEYFSMGVNNCESPILNPYYDLKRRGNIFFVKFFVACFVFEILKANNTGRPRSCFRSILMTGEQHKTYCHLVKSR